MESGNWLTWVSVEPQDDALQPPFSAGLGVFKTGSSIIGSAGRGWNGFVFR
jgi:hypothetical protein